MLRIAVIVLFTSVIATAEHASAQKKRGLVGALLGAGAASATAAASGARKEYGPNDLRPDALKSCLVAAYEIDQGEDRLEQVETRLTREQAAIAKERSALERLERDAKDRMLEQAEVDQYNARVRRFDARVRAFNSNVEEYRKQRGAMSAKIDGFNKDCAGKKYYVSDLATIRDQLPFDPGKYSSRRN